MAMSRTSFMPARTLTRPEMASTADESCTWLTCSVFTASSTSLRIAAWSGAEEAMISLIIFGAGMKVRGRRE